MKIPIEIKKIRDPDGVDRLRATISFQDAITNTSLDRQLIKIQQQYVDFIEACKNHLLNIQKDRKNRGNPVLKWILSDTIYKFLKGTEENGFVLMNMSESLSRDLKISKRQINYLVEFRVTYPRPDLLHKDISWDKYKELLDIPDFFLRKKCEEKILKGELKTRNDIRLFKKQHSCMQKKCHDRKS